MVEGNLPGDSKAYQIRVPCIVFLVVTPLFLGARISSRLKSRSGLGWDDWTIIISWIFAQTVSGLLLASCEYGFGQHIFNLSIQNKITTLKLFYVAQAFYKVTLNLTKASILLLYLRIFVQRWFRVSCHILLGIIICFMIATTASSIWQCNPVARAWDKTIPGTCISITANWYANAGFSIATDVVILVLPMQPIFQSKLPTRQKWALMIVFALGIFVTVTSILRMQTLNFSSTSPDTTYDITSSIWTVIEENVAILCACLPMCKGPLSLLFPSVFKPTPRNVSKKSSTGNSSRSNWTPMRGDREKLSTRVTSIQGRLRLRDRDDTSEEYILDDVEPRNVATNRDEDNGGGIRKVTEYEIKIDEQEGKTALPVERGTVFDRCGQGKH
ncbi:integral membrane protein [Biscogniauxia marginata]|nr:integral membrane protein [Biscogniauxia marginata]